jgi:hypothetical protein
MAPLIINPAAATEAATTANAAILRPRPTAASLPASFAASSALKV